MNQKTFAFAYLTFMQKLITTEKNGNYKMKKNNSFLNTGLLIFVIIFVSVSSFTCKKSPTGPGDNIKVNLSTVDVSCTEAWLKVKAENVSFPVNLTIKEDEQIVYNSSVGRSDSVIYIDSLLPNKTYTLQGSYTEGSETHPTNKISFRTLDSTSSSFSYKLYTLGNAVGESSMLYDVSIISDTSIWVVGEIQMADTNVNGYTTYNAVHWNGSKWVLKRIEVNFRGNQIIPPLYGIYTFRSNDIWLSSGVPVHGDGKNWTQYHLFDMGVLSKDDGYLTKIWGNSSNNLYYIGTKGTIVHYYNGNWSKIRSGTSLDLYDIYSGDGKNIYTGGGDYRNYNGVLIKGTSNNWEIIREGKEVNSSQIFDPYFGGVAASVWISKSNIIYFGGELLYRIVEGKLDYVKTLPGNYLGGNSYAQHWGLINRIRGITDNDMLIVGERNTIRYFNGIKWIQLGMSYNPNSNYDWLSVSIKDNLIVIVGFKGMKATIMMLKRN